MLHSRPAGKSAHEIRKMLKVKISQPVRHTHMQQLLGQPANAASRCQLVQGTYGQHGIMQLKAPFCSSCKEPSSW